jgi:hypothetical protein
MQTSQFLSAKAQFMNGAGKPKVVNGRVMGIETEGGTIESIDDIDIRLVSR